MIKRGFFVSAVVAMTVVLSGCSAGWQDGGGRLAPSLKALFDQALEREDLSDWDRAALEKASEEGQITQADYVEGMDLFDSCMRARGLKFTRTTLLNGVIEFQPAPGKFSEDEINAQARAQADCYTSTNATTQEFFRMQQANPDLLTDFAQAAVNCLREAGVVGDEFTKDDFNNLFGAQESDSDDFPVDVMDPKVQTCLYSLGYAVKVDNR